MKKVLVLMVAMASTVSSVTAARADESPKPLVVLSLTSQNDLTCESGAISEIGKASELPVWLSSMLKLFDEGRGVDGLDGSRPWGAVVRRGQGLSAYGFVPVTDAEELSWQLSSYIDRTEEVGNEVYRVIGTDGDQLYAKLAGEWLLVSDCPESLQTTPADPAKVLGGLNHRYDVAVRLDLKNVPAEHGKKLLAMLDKKLGSTLRRVASEPTMELIGKIAYGLDEVTLGWSPRGEK